MKKVKDPETLKPSRALGSEGKRLLHAVHQYGIQRAVERVNITQHTFQRWARNDDKIEELILNELLIQLGISKTYIKTGKGIWQATTEEQMSIFGDLVTDLVKSQKVKEDVQMKRVIDLTLKLELSDKELLINVCHKLLQEKKNKNLRSVISLILNLPRSSYESAYKQLLSLEKKVYD
ncbi:hypothetical protein [Leptospira johnsonii]|uniref:Uncharacterized protein n=1 Tax=Leptospira johnsonii TaxID=1917820 RepID=A0A2P2D5X1_9LEPT|nr:hypothetical protein [Leptospira johnsonii]GBF40043.1 hypothetical protein LPTSP1_30540 [Leptospira johnsonii]